MIAPNNLTIIIIINIIIIIIIIIIIFIIYWLDCGLGSRLLTSDVGIDVGIGSTSQDTELHFWIRADIFCS